MHVDNDQCRGLMYLYVGPGSMPLRACSLARISRGRCLWIMRAVCMWQVPMISLSVCKHGIGRDSYEKTRRQQHRPRARHPRMG